MLFPCLSMTMLAVESSDVVALRLVKLAGGGWDAVMEAELMVSEKVDAVVEAFGSACCGATPAMVVARFRERVAANAARLGTAREMNRCASPLLPL